MKKLFATAFAFACVSAHAQNASSADNAALEAKIETVWNDSKASFYSPKSGLFYTAPIGKIPSPAEMKELKPLKKNGTPNLHGGGSGTEDCSMLGGIILAGLCDRYEVLKDAETPVRARELFNGLILNATAHCDAGFVARGVSPDDCRTIYPGTSRDQYTHFIHGLWKYFRSKMSTPEQRAKISKIFCDIADKMEREVRPDIQPEYSFRFYKGMPDDRGVAKMRFTKPHEAARLAMFYAAAYDVSKKEKYRKLWRDVLPEAVDGSMRLSDMTEKQLRAWVPAYSVLQMEASLEVLHEVETDARMKEKIARAMDLTAQFVEKSPVFDLSKRSARDRSEVINGQLMAPSYKLSPAREELLKSTVMRIDGARDSGGSYTAMAAYWRARKCGYMSP